MVILHIITRLILGGAQQNTVTCCAAQVTAGHRVVLAYGPIYGPEGSLLDEAKRSGAELVEMRWMRRAVLPVHDMLCYRALGALIDRVKPDIVHTHSSKAGIIGRAAAWNRRTNERPAVIHTIHGLPFHDRQPSVVRRAYVAAERWAARRCHKLVGITQAMCDAFIQERIGNASQFEVVPSGVDLDAFVTPAGTRERVRGELGIAPDAPVIGLVARFDPLKGHADLLDTLPGLAARFADVRVIFVGDGWARASIEEKVAELHLKDRVTLTGLVPPTRVAELLAAMDVSVLPSYQEGQARTLVQSLAAGCAIVGYRVGGIPEVCIDGVTGRLADAGNKGQLAEAIASLIESPQLRRKLSDAGRAHVREHFDAKIMVHRLEEIYEATLKRTTAR